MTPSTIQHPRPGMLATIRNRRGLIATVEPFDSQEGRLHRVRVQYTDSDGVAEDTVLWEREHGRDLLEPNALPQVQTDGSMGPREFDALVRAARWTALTPFLHPDGSGRPPDAPISAPFFGAVQVDDFQLVPLLKALEMPRVSLLLADHVGLEKTIEAGLILTDLLIRRRVRRVLILTPASLTQQWQREMKTKLSLNFDLIDRTETHAVQRRLGLDANPWRTFPRIIASYYYLRQPDILQQFLATCRMPEPASGGPRAQLPWDLLIVDEAHNLLPSPFGEDNQLVKALREITPLFEHKLSLTATPHNGHTRSFSGLLEVLDPVRFTQTSEFTDKEKERANQVVVRRLKSKINELDTKQHRPNRFPQRHLDSKQLFLTKEERALSLAVEEFRKAVKKKIAASQKSEQLAGIRYMREFDMTNDSKLFPPRGKWEDQGYRPDEYGHWIKGQRQHYSGEPNVLRRPRGLVLSADWATGIRLDDIQDVALPLTEGRMIGVFDYSEKGWVEGKGRTAVWRDIQFDVKTIEPQYLISRRSARANRVGAAPKVVFMDVTRATNARTFRGTAERNVACGHGAPVLLPGSGTTQDVLGLTALLNSYVCDSILRVRTGGQHLTLNILEEILVVSPQVALSVTGFIARLCFPHERFAGEWTKMKELIGCVKRPWRSLWALTVGERLRVRAIVDALVALLYDLSAVDYSWILRDCDRPVDWLKSKQNTRKLDTKAFWRLEIGMDAELRSTVLAQVAFRELQRVGLNDFIEENDGEGWMLPEALRLADYGLGHDHRAKHHQPVASALGPRFYPWQLEQSVEESWEECERHAEILAKLLPAPDPEQKLESEDDDAVAVDLFGNTIETDLFGNPVYPVKRRVK